MVTDSDNDGTNLPVQSEDRLHSEQAELPEEETPEQRFRKVDRRIRSVLQHNKRLPLVRGPGQDPAITH